MNRVFPGRLTWVWVGLAGLTGSVAGCGRESFVPPSRPTSTARSAPVESARAVFMIVPEVPKDELELWAVWVRREINDQHLVFRLMGPSPAEPDVSQAELVRKAVKDGASALIVVPGDSPDLPSALAEARSQDVPVVLLGRPLPAPAGSKPFPSVTFAPFEDSAGRIVKKAQEDAKTAGRPEDGVGLVLVDKVTDPTSAARVAALKAAAEAAGLRQVEMVPFDGSKAGSAKQAVIDAVKRLPDVAVVLADDADSMRGASEARIELAGKPAFFVGGYIGYRIEPPSRGYSYESCYVDGKVEDLARIAARQAIARLQGEPAEERSSPKLQFIRGSAEVATGVKTPPAAEVVPAQIQNPAPAPEAKSKPQ